MSDPTVATPVAEKYLRLHLCRDVGPIRTANLLRELGSIDAVLAAGFAHLTGVCRVGPKVAEQIVRGRDQVDVGGELARAGDCGVRIICLEDADYPPALRTITDPPSCLYVRGGLQRSDVVALAVVGSRRCTRYGAEQAERFGALLGGAGLTVVSGMARGIDSHAHRGALAAGGRTIAVMGCGLCHLYPPESGELAERIARNGAVVTELPMTVAPDARNFPPRNRIIVGLSLGVLVVEAAKRSGALISARLATEYNREVFAVPGQVDRPHSVGCHGLIKTGGAKLTIDLIDILEDLGETGRVLLSGLSAEGPDAESTARPSAELNEHERRIVAGLGDEPATMEALCEATELPPATVASVVTGLMLKGALRRVGGDMYERINA